MILAAVALGAKADARGDARRPGRQPVPLHRLFGDLSLDRSCGEWKTQCVEGGALKGAYVLPPRTRRAQKCMKCMGIRGVGLGSGESVVEQAMLRGLCDVSRNTARAKARMFYRRERGARRNALGDDASGLDEGVSR